MKFNQHLKSLNRFITTKAETNLKNARNQKKNRRVPRKKRWSQNYDNDDSWQEKTHTKIQAKAWQLKTKMRVSEMDEVKFDEDDEDALILQ